MTSNVHSMKQRDIGLHEITGLFPGNAKFRVIKLRWDRLEMKSGEKIE